MRYESRNPEIKKNTSTEKNPALTNKKKGVRSVFFSAEVGMLIESPKSVENV